ncbi:MAG: hypothetical protein LBS74_05010 [Oscillospiraceae bacterium]|jgi:hypothetical protein|nr:hypothetical protein [Oscillospiraceae bacterium]
MKIKAIALVLALILTLTACGGNSKSASSLPPLDLTGREYTIPPERDFESSDFFAANREKYKLKEASESPESYFTENQNSLTDEEIMAWSLISEGALAEIVWPAAFARLSSDPKGFLTKLAANNDFTQNQKYLVCGIAAQGVYGFVSRYPNANAFAELMALQKALSSISTDAANEKAADLAMFLIKNIDTM